MIKQTSGPRRMHLPPIFLFAALVTGFGAQPSSSVLAHETGDFQIVKASDAVAWRMNKKTGEIAVCKLDGDQMICSSSSTALSAGHASYEQHQARKAQAERARQDHEMAVLDKMMEFFKSMVTMMTGNTDK